MKKQNNTNTKMKSQKSKKSEVPKKKKIILSREKDKLLKQLNNLIENIDEEGLILLVQQAQIILHNMQVNMKIKGEKGVKKSQDDDNNKKAIHDKYTIDIKEGEDNSYFVIIINKARNFFSLDEMKKLVKICHISNDEMDASERLYNWFSKNRKDVIADTDINGSIDPALKTIFNLIISKYIVK